MGRTHQTSRQRTEDTSDSRINFGSSNLMWFHTAALRLCHGALCKMEWHRVSILSIPCIQHIVDAPHSAVFTHSARTWLWVKVGELLTSNLWSWPFPVRQDYKNQSWTLSSRVLQSMHNIWSLEEASPKPFSVRSISLLMKHMRRTIILVKL